MPKLFIIVYFLYIFILIGVLALSCHKIK